MDAYLARARWYASIACLFPFVANCILVAGVAFFSRGNADASGYTFIILGLIFLLLAAIRYFSVMNDLTNGIFRLNKRGVLVTYTLTVVGMLIAFFFVIFQ